MKPGTRFGRYEVIAPLGAGGMGEVFRARDTELGRDVAVKVLPEALAADPGALARFEQEAKAVASLSHPNILAIHDFGTEDGVRFAVTELLEGATLREKLESGPMPVRKALDYAIQMARGLAAAHDRGVVHRDVKPDNVFVTSDGVVKILDFGLARQVPVAPGGSNADLPTVHTDPHTVLGTAGYMSPEQVRAQAADRRSDIFSFGCVLYEMLSGRRAFARGTTVETMTAILNDDPPAFETLTRPGSSAAAVPPALSRLVLHCLEKDPNDRFQSARDLAFDLQSLASPSSSETAAPRVETRRLRAGVWLAVSVLVAGAGAVAFLAGDWFGAGRSAANRVPVAEVRPLTFQPALELDPSLSPDGQTFVFSANYTGNEDIWVQRVGGQNPLNLTKGCDKRDRNPAFSPTGDWIVYRTECEGGGIWVMGATGESARRLTNFGFDPAWSPDGLEVVVATESRSQPYDASFDSALWVVNAETSEKRLLFKGDAVSPSWSPHGFRIAYWRQLRGQRDIATVAATAPSPAQPATPPLPVSVTDDAATDWNPVWSPDGNYLYFGSDRGGSLNLWRVAIDERTGKTRGLPEPVTLPAPWSGRYSISRDGSRIIYRTLTSTDTVYRVSFDPETGRAVGQATSILGTSLVVTHPDVSPDGQSIAFATIGSHGDLFLMRPDGTSLKHLTDDPARDRRPVFSPIGARIAFVSTRSGQQELWTILPDRSEPIPLTSKLTVRPWFPNWSPNGHAIVFPDGVDNHLVEFGWPPTDIRHEVLPRPQGEPAFLSYSWSPDGTRLAGHFNAQRDEDRGLALYTFATRQYERLARSGSYPLWLPDSHRLLYLDNGAINLFDTTTRTAHIVVETREGPPVTCFTVSHRDGRLIYFVREQRDGDIWLATLKK